MKITKLKKGYRINLTDTEMELLRDIHSEGLFAYQEMHEEGASGLNPAEKRILTEINNGKREWL
jgi:hypothetical protein